MIICTIILLPLYILLQFVIPVIQQILTTVCSWVSTIITTFQTVWNQICSWLPWPLNVVCNWVSQVITVFQTLWNYICNTIITAIVTYINYFLYLLVYVLKIICIFINIIIGIFPYLLCKLGLSPPNRLKICVKVLTDNLGNSQVTPAAIKNSIETMLRIYGNCKINVEVEGVEYIVKPAYLTGNSCSASGIFTMWHLWFSQHACNCCNQVTVFFVDDIPGYVTGCAIPGDNWCRVDNGANTDPTIMAHEVGHLLNLWPHSSDPNNLMYGSTSTTSYNLTSNQCCIMRLSPFVTF